jgi:hypothetical protein
MVYLWEFALLRQGAFTGEIQSTLSGVTKPTVATLTLRAGAAKNSWRLWIVPPAAAVDAVY